VSGRSIDHAPAGHTVGVLGDRWRADVTPWGALRGWDDGVSLDWWVAADDRWHDPSLEPTVRQSRLEGTPVIETRLRIPRGDAVQRVYSVADGGGHTIIELHNDSPSPIALALAGTPVLSQRPSATMPIEGIDLPVNTVAFPIGHQATVIVAIAHRSPSVGPLPQLPAAQAVIRGWLNLCHRASRLDTPDTTATAVVAARCDLLLGGLAAPSQPVDFLLGVGELVRMNTAAEAFVPEVSDAVAALVQHHDDPLLGAALDAAERVCIAAGEARAVRDLAAIRTRLQPAPAGRAAVDATGVRMVVYAERALVDGTQLFPLGMPSSWFGCNFEVHHVPTSPRTAISLAVRWHGERPAVLWEQSGGSLTLTAPHMDAGWSSDSSDGEALWPAPPGVVAQSDDSISFG
jgi:hypothetical protein